ncbi:hypothetical protein I4F81_000247 [Pyropia yezoensis]|uniref:Uncharacterized protein n=1 Tax=Pyropia yezoensis TaxID=2788 RepID=A0ACC3BJH4_PYRYE|nr:hypothetical protein I4F81_000247 [Neopyropia yezoensis]
MAPPAAAAAAAAVAAAGACARCALRALGARRWQAFAGDEASAQAAVAALDASLAAAVAAVRRLPLARGTPADVAARLAGVRLDSSGGSPSSSPAPPSRQPLLHVGTYRLSVTLPPAADIVRSRSFEAAAAAAAGAGWAVPARGPLPLREAVKWALGGRLDAATGLVYAPGGGVEVGVSWAHPAADDAAAAALGGCAVPERRNRRWRPGGGGRDKDKQPQAGAAAAAAGDGIGDGDAPAAAAAPTAPRVSAGAMARVVAAMDAATFGSRVPFPPPPPAGPCTIAAVACLPPLSLAGHYTKASRRVSQTAWYDGPTRVAASATSVEELLLPPALTAALTAPPGPGGSVGVTFSAGGREDVDVRMLGGGRPFVVRVASPSIHPDLLSEPVGSGGGGETGYAALERLMRAAGREVVLHARLTWGDDAAAAGGAPPPAAAAEAGAPPAGGESPVVAVDVKRRRLDDGGGVAVAVAAADPPPAAAAANGNPTTDDAGAAAADGGALPPYRLPDGSSPWDAATGALLLRQATPLRVLHRRTSATRIRAVTACRVVRAVTPRVAVVDVTTAAGTYVKEFVHGDWGRTVPSVGGLLGVTADILQLDVRGISTGE